MFKGYPNSVFVASRNDNTESLDLHIWAPGHSICAYKYPIDLENFHLSSFIVEYHFTKQYPNHVGTSFTIEKKHIGHPSLKTITLCHNNTEYSTLFEQNTEFSLDVHMLGLTNLINLNSEPIKKICTFGYKNGPHVVVLTDSGKLYLLNTFDSNKKYTDHELLQAKISFPNDIVIDDIVCKPYGIIVLSKPDVYYLHCVNIQGPRVPRKMNYPPTAEIRNMGNKTVYQDINGKIYVAKDKDMDTLHHPEMPDDVQIVKFECTKNYLLILDTNDNLCAYRYTRHYWEDVEIKLDILSPYIFPHRVHPDNNIKRFHYTKSAREHEK